MMALHSFLMVRPNPPKSSHVTDSACIDHAYFVCEPPGEPYYLARIMEFLHANNDPSARIDAIRVNWYYRPKDIQRRVQDTRVVFASMHSDTCPITSVRGRCYIQHLSEIDNLDVYRTKKDSFWFDKLYDRYMHRYYEIIPTSKVINVPQHVKKILDERWKFVLVEIGRGRELTSAVKTCKRCSQYAASHDSVDCAVCKNTHHMACIRPPLTKKPARGFAWACAACSRAQELRLEARNTPTLTDAGTPAEEENMEEDDVGFTSRDHMTRESSMAPESHPDPTDAQIAQANLWPYRYLGVHCRVEDALDYDDRIYPRASSRLGPRHQANVNVWHGRPVELVKPADVKRKYLKNTATKKDNKLSREAIAALEAEKESKLKRPKWVVEEPPGYVARGEDQPVEIKGKQEFTAQVTFKMPGAADFPGRGEDSEGESTPEQREKLVDDFMQRAKAIAPQYGLSQYSVDFLTKALEKFQEHKYDIDGALESLKHLSARHDLKQPELNREEVKRFEEGVSKYGSELHNVARHVGPNFKESRIVRFYYMWKKTERGRQIWGNFEGRRSKKETKRLEKEGSGVKLLDDVADDRDDSAFDNDKAAEKKRGFECKFCGTRKSRQWRRAPGTAPGTLVPFDTLSKTSKDRSDWLTLALCGKCAYLWRRYAIQYESIEEVSKKIAAAGGRASKRKIDEELMRTILEAQNESGDTISASTAAVAASAGVAIPANIIENVEPPKKKPKSDADPQAEPAVEKKRQVPEKPPEPLIPEMPRVKVHPCAVCHLVDLPGDELLKCRDCRLHVHRSCYGVHPDSKAKGWLCDMCHNDHNTQVSTTYECVLCPIKAMPQELMEPLKISHKKKTDREREKERLEREMVQEASRRWRQEQEAAGRPVNPREALKRTAWNNWVHVICAMWTEEIRFGNAELYDAAEGVGFIPRERFEPECKICKTSGEKPTVQCFKKTCPNRFHVGCAHAAEYLFGIDIFVPKSAARDKKPSMRLDGEKGSENGWATPIILCPTHVPERVIHSMLQATDEGTTALQLYAKLYKQADQSTTGTVRRALQFIQNKSPDQPNGIRRDITDLASPLVITSGSLDGVTAEPEAIETDTRYLTNGANHKAAARRCCTCHIDVSPRWWPAPRHFAPGGSSGPAVNGNPAPGGSPSYWRNRDNSQTDMQRPGMASSQMSKDTSNGFESRQDHNTPNGIVKLENSPALRMQEAAINGSEEMLYQCHKCHKQGRDPNISPQRTHPPRGLFGQERAEAEQSFYPPSQPTQPSYLRWNMPPVDNQRHSHPDAPVSQYSWPSRPPSQSMTQHSPGWAPEPRHSTVPLPAPPPSYHQPHHSPADYYPRHAYTSPYSIIPPPPPPPPTRAQPNGVLPHQTSPNPYSYSHSHELPPPPPGMPQYPSPHASRYGSSLPGLPMHQSLHDRSPMYGGPPPHDTYSSHPHQHSRAPSLDSTSHRSYSTIPPAPPSRTNYSVAPPPPAPQAHPPVAYPSPNAHRDSHAQLNSPTNASVPPPAMNLSMIAQSASDLERTLNVEPNGGEQRPITSDGPVAARHPMELHLQRPELPLRAGSVDSVAINASTSVQGPGPTENAPSTPIPATAGADREADTNGDRGPGGSETGARGTSAGPEMPGASASPNLRNLLS